MLLFRTVSSRLIQIQHMEERKFGILDDDETTSRKKRTHNTNDDPSKFGWHFYSPHGLCIFAIQIYCYAKSSRNITINTCVLLLLCFTLFFHEWEKNIWWKWKASIIWNKIHFMYQTNTREVKYKVILNTKKESYATLKIQVSIN